MRAANKLIVITGPTAAGKSAFVYEFLRGLPLTVINADSRQVYRDLVISSAAPGEQEKDLFPHKLYNFLPLGESFSAGEFTRMAKSEIGRAQAEGRVPVLCGGTYFYLHALFVGLLPETTIPGEIQDSVGKMTADAAYARLKDLDPVAAEKIHPHNDRRMRRALMLCLTHDLPISQLKREGGILAEFEILMLVFDMEKAVLQNRVRQRVQQMFDAGITEEAQRIFSLLTHEEIIHWPGTPALTGIGIREFFGSYERLGKKPAELPAEELENIKSQIVQNTIHLIKRQRTWIRNANPRPANTKTVDPSYENAQIASLIKDFLT